MQLGDLVEAKKIRRNSKGLKKLKQRTAKDNKRRSQMRAKGRRRKSWAFSEAASKAKVSGEEFRDAIITEFAENWDDGGNDWSTSPDDAYTNPGDKPVSDEFGDWAEKVATDSSLKVFKKLGALPFVHALHIEFEADGPEMNYSVTVETKPAAEQTGSTYAEALGKREVEAVVKAMKQANLKSFDATKELQGGGTSEFTSGHHPGDPAGYDSEVEWTGEWSLDLEFSEPDVDGDAWAGSMIDVTWQITALLDGDVSYPDGSP